MKKVIFNLLCLNLLFLTSYAQTLENNSICGDPIAGAGTYINASRTAGINILSGTASELNVIDGDLSNYADVQLGVSLLDGGSALSVADSINYYPSGNRVGFVIESVGGILTTDVLSEITINLYRNNALVQTATSGSGLLSLGLLSGTDGLQKIGVTATSDFDEVQIIVNSTLSLLSAFRVYYAFEEPVGCADSCDDPLLASDGASISGTRTGITGICIGCSVSNTANVIDADTSNYAQITQTIGLISSGAISVDAGATKTAGTEAGFLISPSSGILDLSALNNVRITTYLGGTQQESYLANNSLVAVSLLGNSSIQSVSFKTTSDFDEVRLTVTPALALLSDIRVYYAFTRIDSDGDGIYDCMDKCAGNDLMDNDGDGLPDDCDTDDDNDLLSDADENTIHFTNPFDGDTDDDGLTDYQEVNGTSPLSAATNPLLADSDLDGVQDGTEVGLTTLTAYTNPAIFIADTDPLTTTDPLNFDTDGDGFSDGVEDANKNGAVDISESDPNNPCDPVPCPIDLQLTKLVDNSTAALGDTLVYTLILQNTNTTVSATGIQVMDQLPGGVNYVSHSAPAGTTYDPSGGVWDVAAAMTTVDSIGLTITVVVNTTGVITNSAEVIAADQTDDDSTPGNSSLTEDDYANTCTSIPYTLCVGDSIEIKVDSSFTSYQWFKDGNPIAGATNYNYWVTDAGDYTVSIDGGGSCISGLCCPFTVVSGVYADVTIAGTSSICSGTALNLTASSAETIQTYTWRTPGGSLSTASTFTIASANTSQSGNYTLEVTYASGCVARDTFNVQVNQSIIAANLSTTCSDNGTSNDASDDTFTFRINPTGGSGTTYSVTGTGVSETGLTYGVTSSPVGPFNIIDGSFSVTVTDNLTACSLPVTVNPPSSCSSCLAAICIPIELVKSK